MPMPAPRYSLPPKRFVAEYPTSTGRNANGAEASTLMISVRPWICGNIPTREFSPNNPSAVRTLLSAMSRPPPTRIGISGTKMSEKTLMKRVNQLPWFAATSFRSSVETAMLLLVMPLS